MVVVFVRDFRFVRASQLTLDAKKDGPTSSARRDTTRVRRRRCAFAAVGARWQGVVGCRVCVCCCWWLGRGEGQADREREPTDGRNHPTRTFPRSGEGEGEGEERGRRRRMRERATYCTSITGNNHCTNNTTWNWELGTAELGRVKGNVTGPPHCIPCDCNTPPSVPPAVVRIIRGRQSGHLQAGRSTLF